MAAEQVKYRQQLLYSLLRDSEIQPITLAEIRELWVLKYGPIRSLVAFGKCVSRLKKADLLQEVRDNLYFVERFEA